MRRSALFLLTPALLSAASPVVRDMQLTTPDGFTLSGTLTVPAEKGAHPVVILAHQFRSDRNGWKPLTDRLQAAGIATLALDLRGHGQSTRKGADTVAVTDDFSASAKAVGFRHIPGDLAQAAEWVRKQPGIDGRRLALAGSSVGAFSALLAMPGIHPVAALALSPAGTGAFGEGAGADLLKSVRSARAAVMVMASREDRDAASHAEALRTLPGVYVRLVDGSEHGFAYLEAQSDTMAVFLQTYLRARNLPQSPRHARKSHAARVHAPKAAKTPEAK